MKKINHLSHFLLWEKIAKDPNNDNFYLISEDDVAPVAHFKEKLISTMYHAPEDWEFIFLYSNQIPEWGCHHDNNEEYDPFEPASSKRFIDFTGRDCVPGTVTYVIKPETARKLIAQANPFSLPTDQR